MDGNWLSLQPSTALLLDDLDYLREFEGDFLQPPSATQSLGHSDCGRPTPSLSFPSSFAPTIQHPPQPEAPSSAPVTSKSEEQILQEWEKVQKIRAAAARAAEMARHQAEHAARLEAALLEKGKTTSPTTANGTSDQPEPVFMEERIVTWPPGAPCVPPDYDLASHNAPVLDARAQRVLELGNYFAACSTRTAAERGGDSEKEAIREAAEKVGGYQNLAQTLRERITKQQQQR